jgi:nitrogen fixation protein NifU and related proteins
MLNTHTKNLYQDVILDHNKKPRNYRVLEGHSHMAHGDNPLCGDKLDVYLTVDENKVVVDVSFIGDGCAISKASASMMTTMVKGKPIEEVETLFHEFHKMSTGKLDPDAEPNHLGRLKIFAGVRDLPARVKCATLAWHTLDAALKGERIVSTE